MEQLIAARDTIQGPKTLNALCLQINHNPLLRSLLRGGMSQKNVKRIGEKSVAVSRKVGPPISWRIRLESPNCNLEPGLGHFRIGKLSNSLAEWIYVDRSGREHPTSRMFPIERATSENPPPLPQESPAYCDCLDGAHYCRACGTDYWHDAHGMAYGHCSYCYATG
jgi:hypothetical protein